MTRYEVTARRDGRWWYVDIPALDGATQARHLGEVEMMATEYISAMTNQGEHLIQLDVTVELPPQARAELERLERARSEELAARNEANLAAHNAATLLKQNGYTVREIGVAMNVSHQRAQQLLQA